MDEQGQPESVAVLVIWAASSVLPEGRTVEQLDGQCVGHKAIIPLIFTYAKHL